jgi:acyl-CoA thioester hydrolase
MATLHSFESTNIVRWADVDANRHLRHSAFADYAAHSRMEFLTAVGFTAERLAEWNMGPVIFREESRYYRELHLMQPFRLRSVLKTRSEDFRKFTLLTEFLDDTGTVLATVEVDGAWFDLGRRKVTAPPAAGIELLAQVQPQVPAVS